MSHDNLRQRFIEQARWTTNLRQYLYRRISLATTHRILEVGCGFGAILGDFDSGFRHVFGLDISLEHLRSARLTYPQIYLLQSDALQLPFAPFSFDVVTCHYLLLWLADPLTGLVEMSRVARHGGWVVALAEPDYGGRIDYPDPLAHIGRLQEEALARQGADTRIGRRLGHLFHQAGLRDVQTGVMGGEWQADSQAIQNYSTEWDILLTDLSSAISIDELSDLQRIDQKAWLDGERILFVPTFFALGRRP